MEKRKKQSPNLVRVLSRSESLCSICLQRQGASPTDSKKFGAPPSSCSLCKGSSSQIDQISERALAALNGFEFKTFLVGATIPQATLDKEDEIRARFKIKGREGMKTQATRAIAKRIRSKLEKAINYARPDITILASLVDGSVATSSRSIWISGAYVKKQRGLSQRFSVCTICNGIGCASCNYTGASSQSIESILSSHFKQEFQAESCNFIWIGSEDPQSLVCGRGRPFYIELVSPRKRTFRPLLGRHKTIDGRLNQKKKVLGPVELLKLEILQSRPKSIPQFRVRCLIYLIQSDSESEVKEIDTKAIESFKDVTTQVHLSRKYRVVTKKIYSVKVERSALPNLFTLEIHCDGGIPLRKFVTGDGGVVIPNLSGYIRGYSIDANQPFDILSVEIMPSKQQAFTSKERSWKRHGRQEEKHPDENPRYSKAFAQEPLI